MRPAAAPFDMMRLDWFDLRNMLLVARTVTESALARTESRGAHQREDFPACCRNGSTIRSCGSMARRASLWSLPGLSGKQIARNKIIRAPPCAVRPSQALRGQVG